MPKGGFLSQFHKLEKAVLNRNEQIRTLTTKNTRLQSLLYSATRELTELKSPRQIDIITSPIFTVVSMEPSDVFQPLGPVELGEPVALPTSPLLSSDADTQHDSNIDCGTTLPDSPTHQASQINNLLDIPPIKLPSPDKSQPSPPPTEPTAPVKRNLDLPPYTQPTPPKPTIGDDGIISRADFWSNWRMSWSDFTKSIVQEFQAREGAILTNTAGELASMEEELRRLDKEVKDYKQLDLGQSVRIAELEMENKRLKEQMDLVGRSAELLERLLGELKAGGALV